MQKVIAVKRSGDKNLYYFSASEEYAVGDKVVVDFEEFQTVATVARVDVNLDAGKVAELNKVTRRALEGDLKRYTELQEKAKSWFPAIKKKSLELGLVMKFISAEYSMDNSKIVIVFSSEERVDFRQFLKDLATMLKTRIELKQIGQRDEVKVCGGVGPCGQPCCCARFLDDFEHVTVKMAKIQGLSLSPTKINGICGRLMCCLGYETSTYEEAIKKMPKVGSEIVTPKGKGVVVYNDLLRERVSVKRQSDGDSFVVEDYELDELNGSKKATEQHANAEERQEPKKEHYETKKEHHEGSKNGFKKHENRAYEKEPVGLVIEEAKNENAANNNKNDGSNNNKSEGSNKKFHHKRFHGKRK